MTQDECRKAIENLQLPRSALDSFWNIFPGFFFLLIIDLLGIWDLIKRNPAISVWNQWLFVAITITLTLIYIYFLATDRKLIRIFTNLPKIRNEQVVEMTLQQLHWNFQKLPANYACEVPFLFRKPGFDLTIIAAEGCIYYNLRNRGTDKGRLPFLFGLETFNGQKFREATKKTIDLYA